MMLRRIARVCLVSVTAACIGCSGDGRVAVSGTVTLDGKPLDKGTIEFAPAEGAAGMLGGGMISNGEYSVPADKGLLPGTYTVRIYSAEPPSGEAADQELPPGGEKGGYPMAKDVIPPQYNSQSTLTAEVKSGGGNRFAFELTSK